MSVVTGFPSSTIQTEEGIEVTSTATNIATKETSSVPIVTIPYASDSEGGVVKSSDVLGDVAVSSNGVMSLNRIQTKVTLTQNGWANHKQIIYMEGIHEDGVVIAGYTQESAPAVSFYQVHLQGLIEGGIVATCVDYPNTDIDLNIFVL